VTESIISSDLRNKFRLDNAKAHATAAPAAPCGLCSMTPMSHGLLPVAGSIVAFLLLVFFCR